MSRTAPRSVLVAVLAAVVGGLLLAGGAAGEWVTATEIRTVGGVEVREDVTVGGVEYAATAIPVGFGAALGGVMLAVVRGTARRVLGGVLVAAGAGGVVMVALGVGGAAGQPGTLGPAPGIAVAGGAAVAAGGLLALCRPRAPVLGRRYEPPAGAGGAQAPPTPVDPGVSVSSQEGDPGNEEWRLTSTEPDEAS